VDYQRRRGGGGQGRSNVDRADHLHEFARRPRTGSITPDLREPLPELSVARWE
jgi:hypothetical protein